MSLLSESVSLLLFAGGAILLVAEAVVPGAHFFVLGTALLTAGLVGFFLPVGGLLGIAILAVAVLATTGLTLWGYRQLDLYGGEGAAGTSSSSSLQGKFGRVTERVTETSGEVKLEDGGFNPHYQARAVDGEIAEGTEVMVVDPGGGNVVTVTPVAEADQDRIDRELARERAEGGDAAEESASDDARATESDTA